MATQAPSFDAAILGQQPQAPAQAQSAPSFDSEILGSAPAPASTAPQPQNNSFDSEIAGSSQPSHDAVVQADTPWYSQLWQLLNRPLISGNVDAAQHPLLHGTIGALEGFSSPAQLALLLGTLPFGEEGAALDAGMDTLGKKIGGALLGNDAASIAKAGSLAKKVLPAVFTAQQVQALSQVWPQLQDAYRHKDWDRFEELLPSTVLGGLGLVGGAYGLTHGTALDENPNLTPLKKLVGKRSATLQDFAIRRKAILADIDKVTKDPARLAAISNYLDFGGDQGRLAAAEQGALARNEPKLAEEYHAAQNLTPGELDLTQRLNDYFNRRGIEGQAAGLFNRRENYGANRMVIADKEGNIAAPSFANRFSTANRYSQGRYFGDYAEGEKEGFQYNKNIRDQLEDYDRRFAQTLANRQFIAALTNEHGSDSRPLAAQSGLLRHVENDAGNPASIVHPDFAIDPLISKATREGLGDEWQTLVDSGQVYQDNAKRWHWSTNDYRNLDNAALRRWAMIGQDTAGNNVFMRADLRLHPEIADQVGKLIDRDPGFFGKNPVGRAYLSAAGKAKKLLLSFSPFHFATEALRHIQETGNVGEVFHPPDVNPDDPRLQAALNGGLYLHDPYSAHTFAEGLGESSGIAGKVPIVGKLWNQVSDYLFNDYIPKLKAADAVRLVDRLRESHPDWSDAQIGKVAADQANAAYGGLNYEMLGRSANAQNWARALLLAPDFLESQLRYGALALSRPGDIARQNLARMAGLNFLAAQLGNLMTTGRVRLDQPFGVALPQKNGQEKVLTTRTLPSDFVRMITEPLNFSYYRLNPYSTRAALEAFGGGTEGKRSPIQQVKDYLTQFVPISGQAIGARLFGLGNPRTTPLEDVSRSIGATIANNPSNALRTARELESKGLPASMTPAEKQSARTMAQVVDGLRSKQIGFGDVMAAINGGKLTPAQARRAMVESQRTPLQVTSGRLSVPDLLQVWRGADKAERQELRPILQEKLRHLRPANYSPSQLEALVRSIRAALVQP